MVLEGRYGRTTYPTLPTLNECSANGWISTLTAPASPITSLDYWASNPSYRLADNALNKGVNGARLADDVILNNVIGFDVKAWDPVAGGYVDLGFTPAVGGVRAIHRRQQNVGP